MKISMNTAIPVLTKSLAELRTNKFLSDRKALEPEDRRAIVQDLFGEEDLSQRVESVRTLRHQVGVLNEEVLRPIQIEFEGRMKALQLKTALANGKAVIEGSKSDRNLLIDYENNMGGPRSKISNNPVYLTVDESRNPLSLEFHIDQSISRPTGSYILDLVNPSDEDIELANEIKGLISAKI